ncbi:MAG TPA: hypothetical protein VNM16_01265, partial [Bacillota bacterium]|nr:hypothetical protein [Bacillota bacterium]
MQVRVDWSPPNEFLASLATAVTPVLARHGEMGPAWAARARKVLTPVQAAAATPLPRIQPLVAKSGCRTVPAFMEYLGNL